MPPRLRVIRTKRSKGRHTLRITLDDGRTLQRTSCYDRAGAYREGLAWLREIEQAGPDGPMLDRRREPLARHLQAFAEHRASRGMLLRAAAELGWSTVGSLANEETERWLKSQPWAPKTRLQNAKQLRAFGAWLVARKLLTEHPLRLRGIKDGPAKFNRGWFTPEMLGALIETAKTRGPDGQERALIYTCAGYTGLRKAELMGLRWGQITFGLHPAIALVSAKTRKQSRVELPAFVAELLRAHRRESGPMDPVFALNTQSNLTCRMRFDLVAAGLAHWVNGHVEDANGRTLHVHALRHGFATLLVQQGATVPETQRMLRHSSASVTFAHYVHAPDGSIRRRVESLPPPKPPTAAGLPVP